MRAPVRVALGVAAALAAIGLLLAAAAADLDRVGIRVETVVFDVAAGAALFLLSAFWRGDNRLRWLWFAAGAAWCVASLAPALSGLHQGLLLAGVTLCVGVARRDVAAWALLAAATVVATGLVPQVVVGVAFLAAGIRAVLPRRASWGAATAGFSLGTVASGAWILGRLTTPPPSTILVFDIYAVVVAVAATVIAAESRLRYVDNDLAIEDAGSGFEGWRDVLAAALRDPALEVTPASGPSRDADVLDVEDNGAVVAHVRVSRPIDVRTRESVVDATRLVAARARLADAADAEHHAVDAARQRLAGAAESERAAMMNRLETRVLPPLYRARDAITAERGTEQPSSRAAAIISEAISDLTDTIRRIPEARFRSERLADALRDLAPDVGPRLLVQADSSSMDPEVAACLYFVACEAVTNAVKHSRASLIRLRLGGDDRDALLVIADDGVGGADASGSGLAGLSDRVGRLGGRVELRTHRGTGTTLVASVPRWVSRSSPTGSRPIESRSHPSDR